MYEGSDSICEQVRAACGWVAGRARSVHLDEARVDAYAEGLMPGPAPAGSDPATELVDGDREARAAFVVCLDAINFGSGWWPTIRKRPGHSGYFTIAAGLTERFRDVGPWSAAELREMNPSEIAAVLGQDADHPLMADYAEALRDVGERVGDDHGGRFTAVIDAAGGSAVALADLLSGWRAFEDVSEYEGHAVPFFKRAQIAAADVDRMRLAAPSRESDQGGGLRDVERLTAFADNLVPQVLRLDGVLRLAPALETRIEAGELLEHGSAEEVELRACAVHAVELLSAATGGRPAEIDTMLWRRGGGGRYKSRPRPRSRNTAY